MKRTLWQALQYLAMTVDRSALRDHYDRLGERQDLEAWYEDPAFDDLCGNADFEGADRVVEIGPGTGRFAERLIRDHLPPSAIYIGIELSGVMAAVAARRLDPYGSRRMIAVGDGARPWPLRSASCDRVVATFVIDLLSARDIEAVLSEAHRVLRPDGLLCLASMSHGETPVTRARALLWSAVRAVAPLRVGGCRPVSLTGVSGEGWSTVSHVQRNIKNFAVASMVAKRLTIS